MIITKYLQVPALGTVFNFKHYQPIVPSNVWVVFLHGQGECGPVDGSELDRVDKNGWTKDAKAGFEFPFNIIAPQCIKDHREHIKLFPSFVKLKYNAELIFVTGLSLGGYGTYDALLHDDLQLIYAIAPVCGAGRLASVTKYRQIPIWHFHGENDTTVSIKTAKAFIDKYNALYEPDIRLTPYPGVGHNSWVQAYSIQSGEDHLLQQFKKWIVEAPKKDLIGSVKSKIINFIQTV